VPAFNGVQQLLVAPHFTGSLSRSATPDSLQRISAPQQGWSVVLWAR
jgi:hypothetical protein